MNRIIRYINIALLILLLPSLAFSGDCTTVGCRSCEFQQVEPSSCCRDMDSSAMDGLSGMVRPLENGNCSHDGYCQQNEQKKSAILSSMPADYVLYGASPVVLDDLSFSHEELIPDPFILPPERLAPLYILHCAYLI